MFDDSSNLPRTKKELSGAKAAFWSVASVSGIYFVLPVIAAVVVYWIVSVFSGWPHTQIVTWLNESITAQFVYMTLAQIFTVVTLVLLLRRFGWTRQTIGLVTPKLSHLMIGLAAAVPYFVLYILLVMAVSAFVPGLDINQRQEVGFENAHTTLELIMTFISLVILPPLVEEVTMRGFLYTGLRKWLPRVFAALLVSGLFGAAHLAEGGDAGPLWIGALDTFTLSLVLVSLREITGNLWAGITLHMLKNGVAFVVLFTSLIH
jgi:membrane protease YdiL (CAAX protease family)